MTSAGKLVSYGMLGNTCNLWQVREKCPNGAKGEETCNLLAAVKCLKDVKVNLLAAVKCLKDVKVKVDRKKKTGL